MNHEQWIKEEMEDIDQFIKDCYENDEVWENEIGEMITYDTLVNKFTFFWEGKMKFFDSHETAEDWIKLNQARKYRS